MNARYAGTWRSLEVRLFRRVFVLSNTVGRGCKGERCSHVKERGHSRKVGARSDNDYLRQIVLNRRSFADE